MQELQMFLYKHCLVWYCYQNTKTVIEEEKNSHQYITDTKKSWKYDNKTYTENKNISSHSKIYNRT